jgi:uncharacterized repeat protein (TIGR02543 family)
MVPFAACGGGSNDGTQGGGQTNTTPSGGGNTSGGNTEGNGSGSGNTEGGGNTSGGGDVTTQKTVKSGVIKTAPTKTDYYLDDVFDGTGGVITVTYEDGTTDDIPMTDSRVETNLKTATVGNKTVTITVSGKKVGTIKIKVTKQTFVVTFDYGYDGKDSETYNVDKGSKIDQPTTPDRGDAYQFVGWFSDEEYVNQFDFSQGITSSLNLHAKWVDLSAGAYKFTFTYNYTGAANATYFTYNQNGTATKKIADPERVGYKFDGWFTAEDGGTQFDFSSIPEGDTVVYAHWTKTATGKNEYIFEVENCDLTGKTGAGASGTTSEDGMLISDSSLDASGGYYLSYQYIFGCSVEFVIVSDSDVSDVTFVARLSAEARDYTFTPSNYQIAINGVPVQYSDIVFTGVPALNVDSVAALPFKDFTIGTNLSLKKGVNRIKFTTNNRDSMAGTTFEAAAPLIDCIKLTTEAVLIWDSSIGLPMHY